MTRDEQEMTLWRESYTLAISQGDNYGEADKAATTAAESFRKRYPAEPAAPAPAWYDEPPFPKDANSYRCWVADWGLNRTTVVAELYWYDDDWRMQIVGSQCQYLLAGRRVCPIAKPPEPTT